MFNALLAALWVASASAEPPKDSAAPSASSDARIEEIRRELEARFEQKLEEAKASMREEMRAQLAAQSAQEGFSSEIFASPRRHLDIFVPHGYLRLRPDLFNKFDLN